MGNRADITRTRIPMTGGTSINSRSCPKLFIFHIDASGPDAVERLAGHWLGPVGKGPTVSKLRTIGSYKPGAALASCHRQWVTAPSLIQTAGIQFTAVPLKRRPPVQTEYWLRSARVAESLD